MQFSSVHLFFLFYQEATDEGTIMFTFRSIQKNTSTRGVLLFVIIL